MTLFPLRFDHVVIVDWLDLTDYINVTRKNSTNNKSTYIDVIIVETYS